jgi:hypothetical protein
LPVHQIKSPAREGRRGHWLAGMDKRCRLPTFASTKPKSTIGVADQKNRASLLKVWARANLPRGERCRPPVSATNLAREAIS